METKTHYRKVFKSDHLGIADLEDMIEEKKALIFTVKEVKQEIGVTVAGKKGNFNIAYFKESIKPLVLNATNSKVMKGFCGGSSFVEDWKDVTIRLYIDPSVKMKGEVVGGVRISPKKPVAEKTTLPLDGLIFKSAKKAYSEGRMDQVKKHYIITPEIEKLLAS